MIFFMKEKIIFVVNDEEIKIKNSYWFSDSHQ